MANEDGESRRRRLRELRDLREDRGGRDTLASGDDDRIDRALAERRRPQAEEGAPGEGRPLDRFPRLREALARKRQGQGKGGQGAGLRERPASAQPPSEGTDRTAKEGTGGRVMFARRLRDVPAKEADGDRAFKLERLERRIERLRDELARSAEELHRLKEPGEPEQRSPAPQGQLAATPTEATAPSALGHPELIDSPFEEEGQAEPREEGASGETKR